MMVHVVVIRLFVIFQNWEILIQVEGHYIFKTYLSISVHPNQLVVDT